MKTLREYIDLIESAQTVDLTEGIMDVVKQTFNDNVAGWPMGTSDEQFIQGWARDIKARTGKTIPTEKLVQLYNHYTKRSPELMQTHSTTNEQDVAEGEDKVRQVNDAEYYHLKLLAKEAGITLTGMGADKVTGDLHWQGDTRDGRRVSGTVKKVIDDNGEYIQGVAEAISKNDLLGKLAKDSNTLFKKAKAGKLKSTGKDFTKGDHWTGPDKDDPSYTRNFGHGYPDTPSNRSHDRYVNKSLKKDIDEADETSWTANSSKFRQEEDLSWPVEITLEPRADINRGRGAQVKTMTVTGQSRDAAKKKLVDYYRKNGWAVTGIKFTGDLDEGSFAHDQLKGEINDLFKPVVLQIVKWARAEGMTAKDLAGTSSHFFLDALDPDTYDRTQHLPDNYFNKLMDKANAKAVEILKKKGVAEEQLEETETDPIRRIEELFRNK